MYTHPTIEQLAKLAESLEPVGDTSNSPPAEPVPYCGESSTAIGTMAFQLVGAALNIVISDFANLPGCVLLSCVSGWVIGWVDFHQVHRAGEWMCEAVRVAEQVAELISD